MGAVGFLGSAAFGLARGGPLPAIHDEFSYLLGADTFAEGRLTNPTHPHWKHFETFHVIHQPTYQSKYPPAQALLLATGKRIGGRAALGLWLGAGALAAALTWALLTWLPSHWGLLAGVLGTLQLTWFTYWSQSYWGGTVAALGGALAFGSLRSLWRHPDLTMGLILGTGLAVLAASRPFEGALVGTLIAGALIFRLLQGPKPHRRAILVRGLFPAAVVVGASLGAQGVYNHAVTGSPVAMPYQVAQEQYAAAPAFLFQAPGPAPSYRHAVMEEFWMQWARESHERNRELQVILTRVPAKIRKLALFFLGPGVLALVGLGRAPDRRWVAYAGVGVLLVVAAALLTRATFAHYVAPVTVLFYVLLGAGMRGLHRRARTGKRVSLAFVVVGAFALTLPINAGKFLSSDRPPFAVERASLLADLEAMPGDHLVFVEYGPNHNVHQEWVFNRADIDASGVVWARTIDSSRDRELIEYFSGRVVWNLKVDGRDPVLEPHPLVQRGRSRP
ncbi:MAG: hypothetical protein ACLF0P_00050 [Thermoanaerobaculia bacterium]